MLNNGNLTTNEQDEIRAIAHLCPEIDGKAVYTARALIRKYDSTFVNYKNPCEQMYTINQRAAAEQREITEDLELNMELDAEPVYILTYPNPAQNVLNVSVNTQESTIVFVDLINMLGQSVAQQSVVTNGAPITFNTSNLVNGIYVCKIKNQNGELIQNKKVLINAN